MSTFISNDGLSEYNIDVFEGEYTVYRNDLITNDREYVLSSDRTDEVRRKIGPVAGDVYFMNLTEGE